MSASAYDKIGLQVTQDSCGHDWLLYAHMHMRDDLVYVLVFPFTLACIHLNDIIHGFGRERNQHYKHEFCYITPC